MSTCLFVYGTLKHGQCNHPLLAGQTFLGEARTAPRYWLYDAGPHPCLVEATDGVAVRGELWRVDDATLARLDLLEEIPDLFDRRSVQIQGQPNHVIAYLYQGDITGLVECGAEWKSGIRGHEPRTPGA